MKDDDMPLEGLSNRSGHDRVGGHVLGTTDTHVVLAFPVDLDVAVVTPFGSPGVASVPVSRTVAVGAVTNKGDKMVPHGRAEAVVEDSA